MSRYCVIIIIAELNCSNGDSRKNWGMMDPQSARVMQFKFEDLFTHPILYVATVILVYEINP